MRKNTFSSLLHFLTWVFLALGILFFGLIPGIGFDNLDPDRILILMTISFSLAIICKYTAGKLDGSGIAGGKKVSQSLSGGIKIILYVFGLPIAAFVIIFGLFFIWHSFIR